ncbi:putative transcription factor WRKY family [Medicago truncatula]|uniref:Putative transcription factor WRKY family n=1 Tax=Medicago truncatula TaxID=3880 RepID=G7L427_MEDTR|nr:probable WRKY transcription factor 41 [Medicago truncatula]AES82777.1 WRKY family transcription factor [Medicago truncatula]RHN49533.1 putative transcription factor WRKY family [Medicago truncatula]
MEETTKRKRDSIINELVHGKELANQLSNHIILSSNETNEFLIDKIISTYQKALTMLNVGDGKMKDSHSSFTNESPKSEVIIDQEFNHNALFKKRKSMPKWKEQVKICTNTGLSEGSLDDEYSWRKYGQKDILGAKFSRGYYRCTHRNGQGCLATKQVQRSDEDPTIIEVTYRGRHTCTHSQAKPLKREFPSKLKLKIKGLEKNKLHNDIKNQLQTKGTSFTSKAELDVKRKDLEETKEDIFPWFSFPSPSIGSENEIMMESNFFNLSEYQLGYTGLCQNGPTSESDITDTVSAPTSVTNSPILDLDILLQRGDFDTDFPLNTPEYFSS